jgi:DNA-binding protein YbaB
MGEIKSTLDIIMERTRNLTMTEEEKRAFKEQEMAGKVKGLVQRYLDGSMDLKRVKVEVAGLLEKDKDMAGWLIKKEVMDRIEVGKNNEPLLDLLENTIGMHGTPIRKMLAAFEQRLKHEGEAREKAIGETMKKRGISGSAVLPNLEADQEWRSRTMEIEKEMKERLVTVMV